MPHTPPSFAASAVRCAVPSSHRLNPSASPGAFRASSARHVAAGAERLRLHLGEVLRGALLASPADSPP